MQIRLDYELAMRVASLLYGKKMRRRVYQTAIIAIIIITGSLFLFENSLMSNRVGLAQSVACPPLAR